MFGFDVNMDIVHRILVLVATQEESFIMVVYTQY
jgi:hypothetical protein